jgi:hypothetical protein
MVFSKRTVAVLAAALFATVPFLQACGKPGCLGGDAKCRVPTPCTAIEYQCTPNAPLTVKTLSATDTVPGGWDALGARGDVLLSNDKVTVVVAGLGNQNFLDPNGGSILDLSTAGANNDGVNQILTATGILPRDAIRYTSLELIDESPTRVAIQLKGQLDGVPNVKVSTLYELRPCEPGVRARTELLNGSADTQMWSTSDAFYWSDREPVSFVPGNGLGFAGPDFTLTTIDDAFRKYPFLAATPQVQPSASYGAVACERKTLEGFNNDFFSTVGLEQEIIPPRGTQIFERFLFAAVGKDIASASDLALELREKLFGEKFVTVRGKVSQPVALALDTPRQASIVLSEGSEADPVESRIPWAQIVPLADGSFSARVPVGKRLLMEVHSFGRKVIGKDLSTVSADTDVGEVILPSTAVVDVTVQTFGFLNVDAEVFLVPVNDSVKESTAGSFHGRGGTCAPYLGPPHGPSPACNRVLVRDGTARFEVATGEYDFYAFKGPFWTIDRQRISLTSAGANLSFSVLKLPLQPAGTLGADLHVHGARSYDSSFPDFDRVLSFAAMDLEVIASTEHEVSFDYSDAIAALGFQNQMTAIPGTETTAHIPFLKVPGDDFPRVIGHYNFWPLTYDRSLPRFGGLFDELVEPGELFDRAEPLFTSDTPIIQLNHPWGGPYFGRDTGFPRAIHLDLTKPPPAEDDGTQMGLYVRSPKGGHRNHDHHAMEVMNGTQNDSLPQYRAVWFWSLNTGQLKTGTANSDSHGLTDNTVGVPRTIVYAGTNAGPSFNVSTFNRALRDGKAFGTNGPVIDATLDTDSGAVRYGMTPVKPSAGAMVHVRVSAVPWVPIDEVRFIVNGKVVKTVGAAALTHPTDPFGITGMIRYDEDVPLSDLVQGTQDAWLVVEAGSVLPLNGDVGGGFGDKPDGVPDTGDNNGDGVVNGDDVEDGETIGPLSRPPLPTDPNDVKYHFAQVVTGGFPYGFINPFILDLNGNGSFEAPGVSR